MRRRRDVQVALVSVRTRISPSQTISYPAIPLVISFQNSDSLYLLLSAKSYVSGHISPDPDFEVMFFSLPITAACVRRLVSSMNGKRVYKPEIFHPKQDHGLYIKKNI